MMNDTHIVKKITKALLLLLCYLTSSVAVADNKNLQTSYPAQVQTRDTAWKKVQLTFEQKPQRSLAIHQNNIETFAILGEEDSLLASQGQYVAVTPKDKALQKQLPTKYHYRGTRGINQEKAVYLEPDFIMGWSTSFTGRSLWGVGDTDFWQRRGVNCYTTTQIRPEGVPQTVLRELEYVRNMGIIFNKQQLAEKYIADVEQYVAKVRQKYAHQKKQRVLVLDVYEGYIGTYNREWVVGDMITLLGGDVLEISPWTSKEEVLMTDPDVIFLFYKSNAGVSVKDNFMNERVYQGLQAVRNKRVYALPMTYVLNNSWKIKDGLEIIAHGLYPELAE